MEEKKMTATMMTEKMSMKQISEKRRKDKKNKDKNDKDSKDKKKDRDKEWNREKDRRKNRGRDFRDEREGYREEDLEGTPAEGTSDIESQLQDEDIFIPEAYTGTAMHQDKVRIIILDGQKEGKRQEGVVVKVLELRNLSAEPRLWVCDQ